MKRSPLKRNKPMRKRRPGRRILRAGKVPPNPAYLDYIRMMPCLLAGSGGCAGIVEAAHVGERGMGQKCRDEEAVPLCSGHHRTRPDASHQIGKRFWLHHGLDRDAAFTSLQELFAACGADPSALPALRP